MEEGREINRKDQRITFKLVRSSIFGGIVISRPFFVLPNELASLFRNTSSTLLLVGGSSWWDKVNESE